MIFGSRPFELNLPGFTLNLPMIIGVLLLGISIVKLREKILRPILLSSPIHILSIVSGASILFVDGRGEALLFFRAMLMFSLTSVVVLSILTLFKSEFKRVFISTLWIYLLTCLFVGFIEFFTGIHISGDFTEKLLDLQVGNLMYTPVFLWDNPNTFISIISLVSAAIVLLDNRVRTNFLMQSTIVAPLFFFSFTASSRFGILIAVLFLLGFISLQFKVVLLKLKSQFLLLLGVVILFLLTIINNQLFYGPMWEKGDDYRLNQLVVIDQRDNNLELVGKEELLYEMGKDSLIDLLKSAKNESSSNDQRKRLILNGIDLWKSNPVLGVGAGQYSYKTSIGEVKYNVGTLRGPHNLVIELLSQFGLIGIAFLFFLLYSFYRILRKGENWSYRCLVLAIGLVVLLATSLPSSMMIYNAWWFVVIALIIQATELEVKHQNSVS